MATGTINVTTENIFPIIKKFLYSDHEIFLRELISNATDACVKLKHLSAVGEYKGVLGELSIEVKLDKKKKTIEIIDNGIGMTSEEIDKYINQVAFSGAEEFIKKYDDKVKDSGIIGHFGLGFYSSFMVAEKVVIETKTHGSEDAVSWECDGSPEYTIKESKKKERGTKITLHVADDSKEFLEEGRIRELLKKYCKFMPVSIVFGEREETIKEGEGDKEKESKIKVPDVINNSEPAWIKKPTDLKDTDYKDFYRELYPMNFEEPLFNIHLNVDYPFKLTGVLFFPKIANNIDVQKDKIQLYQNQVYVTDNVEGVVPEFLTLLRGVLDSPDIPLNVSRSYLQSDSAVKKISGYISKKVSDKLKSLYKKDREAFEAKWNDIKIIVQYGMLSDDKFYDKSIDFNLFQTVDNKYLTMEEIKEKLKDTHTDKDGNLIILYSSDKDGQHGFIQSAKDKGYEVLILDSPIISHLIQKLETKFEKVKFARVDSDNIDLLIRKEDTQISKLSEDEQKELKELIEKNVPKENYTVKVESMSSDSQPFIITVPEFMRRMKEMSMSGGGGMFGMSNMPEMYNLSVNSNHDLIGKILSEKDEDAKGKLINHAFDLAKLSQNLLIGEDLTNFVKRNFDSIK